MTEWNGHRAAKLLKYTQIETGKRFNSGVYQ